MCSLFTNCEENPTKLIEVMFILNIAQFYVNFGDETIQVKTFSGLFLFPSQHSNLIKLKYASLYSYIFMHLSAKQ